MASDREMQFGLEFSKGRAAAYQAIADQGGDHIWSQAAAQIEADRFQTYADRLAARAGEAAGE